MNRYARMVVGLLALAVIGLGLSSWNQRRKLPELLAELDAESVGDDYSDAQDAMNELLSRSFLFRGTLTQRLMEIAQKGGGKQSPRKRWRAVVLLGQLRARSAADLLNSLLMGSKENLDVRWNAAVALSRLGPSATAAHNLIAVVANRKQDASLRVACARSLGRLRATEAVETLVKLVTDRPLPTPKPGALPAPAPAPKPAKPDLPELRIAACEALGAIADRRAGQELIQTLDADREPNLEVRRAACVALADIGDPSAVQPLIVALQFPPPRRMGEAPAPKPKVPGAPKPPVDTQGDLRVAAAYALGRLGSPAAIPPLERTYRHDPHYWVRKAAAGALRRLGRKVS